MPSDMRSRQSSLDICMSDAELDSQFPSLVHHSYRAKDVAGRHRNVGSVAIVRASMMPGRTLRPEARTPQLQHMYELSMVPSPMCSRPRLVLLPIAYPVDLECPMILVHTQTCGYDVHNIWFNSHSAFSVVVDDLGFSQYVARFEIN